VTLRDLGVGLRRLDSKHILWTHILYIGMSQGTTKYAGTDATHFARCATFHLGYLTPLLLLILASNEQLSLHGSQQLPPYVALVVLVLRRAESDTGNLKISLDSFRK
jgi:hypothetical protein